MVPSQNITPQGWNWFWGLAFTKSLIPNTPNNPEMQVRSTFFDCDSPNSHGLMSKDCFHKAAH